MRRRLQDERGSVLVIAAAFMVALIVVTALGVDIGNARQTQGNLQSAADAGALAGAQQLHQSPSPSAVQYSADYALDSLNQSRVTSPSCAGAPSGEPPTGSACYPFATGNGFVYVTTPWTDDQPTGNCGSSCPKADGTDGINVKVCQTVNATLARVINVTSFRLCKSATASVFGSIAEPYALFAFGDAQCHGINFNTSNATVSNVIRTNGSFTMNGSNNTLGPTYYGNGCTYSTTGTGNTYNGLSTPLQEPPFPDPCLGSPAPVQCDPGASALTCPSATPADNISSGGNFTPPAGPPTVYCVTGGSNTNIIVDGFNGNATFVVSGGGKINFSCGSTCTVSPAAGGFVVWQKGPSTGCTNEMVTSNGNGSLVMNGTIWAPGAKVNMNTRSTTLNGFVDACSLQINGSVTGAGPPTPVPNSTTPALVR
jgi:Flp pilus assembly protein TadG